MTVFSRLSKRPTNQSTLQSACYNVNTDADTMWSMPPECTNKHSAPKEEPYAVSKLVDPLVLGSPENDGEARELNTHTRTTPTHPTRRGAHLVQAVRKVSVHQEAFVCKGAPTLVEPGKHACVHRQHDSGMHTWSRPR